MVRKEICIFTTDGKFKRYTYFRIWMGTRVREPTLLTEPLTV